VDGLGAACHVLSVSRNVNTESRAREVDLTDQVHVAIEDHYFRPIMELGSPRSESHHCAAVVGFRADGCALKRASARHGIGTDHLGTGNIEQDDLARKPVCKIRAKRTHGGTVARDDGRPTEPATCLTEVNHSLVRGAVKLVNVKVEAASDEDVPITGDPVKNVASAGAGNAEYGIAGAGIDQDSEIILRDECNRAVISQIDAIHSKRIRSRRSDLTSVSLKDVEL
jgi:hypothetical protein